MATTTARAAWRADFGLYRKLVRALTERGLTGWEFDALAGLVRKYSRCVYTAVIYNDTFKSYSEFLTMPQLRAVNSEFTMFVAD